MKQVLKDVKGFEGVYQVSNLGKVRSLDRYVKWYGTEVFRKGKVSKPTVCSPGYYLVTLIFSNTKKKRKVRVHRLVAEAFLDNPEKLETVNHIKGDKLDNRLSNLEWSSYSYNNLHAQKEGLNKVWKLSFRKAEKIRKERKEGTSVVSLSETYGVSTSTIYAVLNNKAWVKEIKK